MTMDSFFLEKCLLCYQCLSGPGSLSSGESLEFFPQALLKLCSLHHFWRKGVFGPTGPDLEVYSKSLIILLIGQLLGYDKRLHLVAMEVLGPGQRY